MMTNQKKAFYYLRLKRKTALNCAEKYGIDTALISIYSIEGYIESLFDMDIITGNTYELLNTWCRNLRHYIMDNYEYKR